MKKLLIVFALCLFVVSLKAQTTIQLSNLIDSYPTSITDPNGNNVIEPNEFSDLIEFIAENSLDESGNTLEIDCYNGTKTIEGYTNSGGKCTYQVDEMRFEDLSNFTIEIDLGVTLQADLESFNSSYLPTINGNLFTNANIDGPLLPGYSNTSHGNHPEFNCATCEIITKPCPDSYDGSYSECYNEDTGTFFSTIQLDLVTDDSGMFCGQFDFTPDEYQGLYDWRYVERILRIVGQNRIDELVNEMFDRIDADVSMVTLQDYYDNLSTIFPYGSYNYAQDELILFTIFQELGGGDFVENSPEIVSFLDNLDKCSKRMIRIYNCEDMTIRSNSNYQFAGNLFESIDDRPIIDMNGQHDINTVSNTCEDNILLDIKSGRNITIENLQIINAKSDNILITGDNAGWPNNPIALYENFDGAENVILENVLVSNPGRNNITPVGFDNLLISNSQIVGANHWNGIGINIEPHRPSHLKGLTVDKCYFKDNEVRHFNFQFYGHAENMDWHGNPENAFNGSTTYSITNCVFDGGNAINLKLPPIDPNYDYARYTNNHLNFNLTNSAYIAGDYPTYGKSASSTFFGADNPGYSVNENDCKDIVFPYDISLENLVIYANACHGFNDRYYIYLRSGEKEDTPEFQYFGNTKIDNVFFVKDPSSATNFIKSVPLYAKGRTAIGVNGSGGSLSGNISEGKITLVDDYCITSPTDQAYCLSSSTTGCCVNQNDEYFLKWPNSCNYDSDFFDINHTNSDIVAFNEVVDVDNCFITPNDDGTRNYSNTFNVAVYRDDSYSNYSDKYQVFKTIANQYAPDINFIPENLTGPLENSFNLNTNTYCNGFTAELLINPYNSFVVYYSIVDETGTEYSDYQSFNSYESIITSNIPNGTYTITAEIHENGECGVDVGSGDCSSTETTTITINNPNNHSADLNFVDPNLEVTTDIDLSNNNTTVQWYYDEGDFYEDGLHISVFEEVLFFGNPTTIDNPEAGSYYAIVTDGNDCQYITNVVHINDCDLGIDLLGNYVISSVNNPEYLNIQPFTTTTINPLTFQLFDINVNDIINVYGNLIIEDITAQFTQNAGIHVHPGGTLTVRNNATLTAYCDPMWKGITVESDLLSCNSPTGSGCGRVEVYNGVTIEKSEVGIKAVDTGINNNAGGFYVGGDMVSINGNSTIGNTNTFKENLIDILVETHPHGVLGANPTANLQQSYIRNTRFERPNDNEYGIQLNDLKNIDIYDCQIVGNPTLAGTKQGNGISSYDGNISVRKTFFSDLVSCVYLSGSNNSTFEDNTFSNTEKGIYAAYADNLSIDNNNFYNIANHQPTAAPFVANVTDPNANFGIHLIETENSYITSNLFQGGAAPSFPDYSSSSAYMTAGLITTLHAANLLPNYIYNNSFEGTNIGYFSQTGDKGVEVSCNTFASDGQEHALTAWRVQDGPYNLLNVCEEPDFGGKIFLNTWLDNNTTFTGNISYYNAPKHIWFTDNLFTDVNGTSETEYLVHDGSTVADITYPKSINESDDVRICLDFVIDIDNNETTLDKWGSECDIVYTGIDEEPDTDACTNAELEYSTLITAIEDLENLLAPYANCICPKIINPDDTGTCCPQFSYKTKPSKGTGFNTNIGGGTWIGNICTAAQCAQIKAWKADLANYNTQLNNLTSNLFTCNCGSSPTISCRVGQLETNAKTKEQELMLAYLYLDDNKPNKAVKTVNKLYSKLDKKERVKVCNDRTLVHLLAHKQRNKWEWNNSPRKVKKVIREWQVCKDNRFKNFAKSVLASQKGKQYFHPVSLKSLIQPVYKTQEQQSEAATENIKVYPNPFNNILFIEYDKEKTAKFILYDLTGKLIVEKQLNSFSNTMLELNNITSGMYFYECRNEQNEVIITDKIIKQ